MGKKKKRCLTLELVDITSDNQSYGRNKEKNKERNEGKKSLLSKY